MRTLTTALALASLLIAPAAMAQATGGAHSATAPAQGATLGAASNTAAGTTGSAGQYQSEAAAKQACGSQTVVWVNTSGSKAWHVSGDKYFGHTKHGAYMCEQAAQQAGYHPAGTRVSKQKTAKAAH
jgi:uncharacterized protein YdeI (BOF family)